MGNQSWLWNSSVHWYGHIGASSDSDVTWWELDAGKAVTNANVFVVLGWKSEYVDVSKMVFALRKNE